MAKKEGLAPKRPLGWSQLFKDIRAGKAAGVYLFYGPEEFVKKSAVDQLRAALLPPGLELLNEDVLENVDATAIIESAETLPVMCDQRFVLVKDWPPLFKGGDQEADKLEKWLPNAPQSCVLVFYAGGAEPNRATKVTKALYEYAQVTEFPLLDDEELGRRLGKAFREQGKKVGLLKIRCMRPFPAKEIVEIVKNAKFVGVLEKDVSFGFEGVVYTDVSSALKSAGVEIPAANYVGGLGGRSIYKTDIEKIYEELLAGTAKVGEASFVNLRRDICGA